MEFALLPVVESAFPRARVLSGGGVGPVAVHAVDWQAVRTEAELVVRRSPRHRRVDSCRARLPHQAHAGISGTIRCSRWPPTTGAKATSGARCPETARGESRPTYGRCACPGRRELTYTASSPSPRSSRTPDRYGVALRSISDAVYFRPVALDGQVELAFAANLAGVSVRELRRLNPGFKRSATAPGGPHRLQLPVDAAERYTAALAQLPTNRNKRWTRHAVVHGDTLGAIAIRYGTSVKALKDTNGLNSNRIFAGTHLTIPVALGLPEVALADSAARGGRSVPEIASFAGEGSASTVHRVRSGDSLWLIARRHGVGVEQLAAWNGLSVESVLMPGQRLTVHRGRTGPVPATLRTNPPKSSRRKRRPCRAARRHAVRDRCATWNDGARAHRAQPYRRRRRPAARPEAASDTGVRRPGRCAAAHPIPGQARRLAVGDLPAVRGFHRQPAPMESALEE